MTAARRSSRSRVLGAGLGVAALVAAVAGCSSDPNSLGAQAGGNPNSRYAEGSGGIEQVPATSRGAALALSGTTVTGSNWSRDQQGAGKVVVVNVWGSWCPPCVTETPALQQAWAAYQSAQARVAFVGIDTMESPETGAAFLNAKGVTYPSINDQASLGAPVSALAGRAPATPSTLVLDLQGRIAARVSGPVTEVTLRTLVDAVLTESGLPTPAAPVTPAPTSTP